MSDYAEMTEERTFCAVHPDRETSLRCNKCDRLMCVQCAVRTPVGYRCRECVRQQDDKFYTAANNDYFIVAGVCAILMGIAAAIFNAIPFGGLFLGLIIGFPLGGGISEVALRVTQRRRGRYSGQIAAAAAVVGGLIGGFIQVYSSLSSAVPNVPAEAQAQFRQLVTNTAFSAVFSDIGLLLFVGLAAVAIYGRYKMRA